jgi:hypothetical protein
MPSLDETTDSDEILSSSTVTVEPSANNNNQDASSLDQTSPLIAFSSLSTDPSSDS